MWQGPTLTFETTCPVGQVGIQSHLPRTNFHLPHNFLYVFLLCLLGILLVYASMCTFTLFYVIFSITSMKINVYL